MSLSMRNSWKLLAIHRPKIIVYKNKLATQLSRPEVYIKHDEWILQEAGGKNWSGDVEKAQENVVTEQLDEKH